MAVILSRRQVLAVSAGAVATAAWAGSVLPAAANNSAELMTKFAAGRQPVKAKVKLDMPDIAENGNTVPMTISVDSPMTEQSHVTDVLVIADGNPNAAVVTFHFTPATGVAEANTRIRLAKSQTVTVLAKMNDGSVYSASQAVKVTIGGCGG